MKQYIHCIVNDCHYWGQGNKCNADKILVATDHFGTSNPDNVDVEMAAELTPDKAGSCMSTCCKSYVSKDSSEIKEDGIKKLNK